VSIGSPRLWGRRRLLLTVALATALVGSTSAIVLAVGESDDGPFTACLGVKTNKGLVYNTASGSQPLAPCNRGDLQIQFSNTAGPQGEPGPTGPPGPDGAQGDPGDVSALQSAIDALEARIEALEGDGGPEPIDADGDGAPASADCDDTDPAVSPGLPEVPANDIDDDCDGLVDEGLDPGADDPDGDGVPHSIDNCPSVANPTQEDADADDIGDACDETPNGEGIDADEDGYTSATGDCDDTNDAIHPGAPEVPGNAVDEDCDGQIDEGGTGFDVDGDGHSADQGDCDDANPDAYPGAIEIADGFDTDCDGQLASRSAYSGPVGTEVGECQAGIQTEVLGGGGLWGPVVGEVLPTAEILDGLDNDCDGTIDEGF
jgi:Putative metal-binding motif